MAQLAVASGQEVVYPAGHVRHAASRSIQKRRVDHLTAERIGQLVELVLPPRRGRRIRCLRFTLYGLATRARDQRRHGRVVQVQDRDKEKQMHPDLNYMINRQHLADVRLEGDRRRLAKEAAPDQRVSRNRARLAQRFVQIAAPRLNRARSGRLTERSSNARPAPS